MWKENFSVSELEFLAEQNIVEIKPNFRKEEIEDQGQVCGTCTLRAPTICARLLCSSGY